MSKDYPYPTREEIEQRPMIQQAKRVYNKPLRKPLYQDRDFNQRNEIPVPIPEIKFHHGQKMNVIKNFYKGKKGIIKNYELDEETNQGIYYIEIELDNSKKVLPFYQDEIKPSWF
jgi:hypothetical protein